MGSRRVFLLLVLFTISVSLFSLNDVFAEKLIVGSADEEPTQFSGLDKTTGNEIQLYSSSYDGFVNGLDFSLDGKLIGAAFDAPPGDPVIFRVSLLTDSGNPFTILSAIPGFENFKGCNDISTSSNGIIYCSMKNEFTQSVDLHQIDIELGQIISTWDTQITFSEGNGIAIDDQDTIFFGNQNGLFTLDPNSNSATQVRVGNTIPQGFEKCKAEGMDFDVEGFLYTAFKCTFPSSDDGESFLGKTDPQTFEILSMEPITRNPSLSNLDENMRTGAIVFTNKEIDFLVDSSYGKVNSGFDSISVQQDTINGEPASRISTQANSEIMICDDTTIPIDFGDELTIKCDDTIIALISGGVTPTFQTLDGQIITADLVTGDLVIFDSEKFALSNVGPNTIVATVNGIDYSIPPGKTLLESSSESVLLYSKFIGKHDDQHWKTYGYFTVGDEKFRKVLGTGTFEIVETEPEPEPEPEDSVQELKLEIIDQLNEKINDAQSKNTKKQLDKAIKHIDNSLKSKYWLDRNTLDPNDGHKSIDEEEKAVKDLMKITSKDKESSSFIEMIQHEIDSIVRIDRNFAQTAIDVASESVDDRKSQKALDKALKELENGDQDVADGKFDKGINHYEKAWKHAQKSLMSDKSHDDDDDDGNYERDDDDDDNTKHTKHDKLQTCRMITGEGVFDFRNSNKLNVEFSGDVCPQKHHSSGDLVLTITGGEGDFADATGDGDVSLVIGKKYFAGKLVAQIGGDADLIVTDCEECIPQPNPPQLIIGKTTNLDDTFDFTVTGPTTTPVSITTNAGTGTS
ncbi:hypothetical protein, partial [Nitrosopumilus sp.]|uniref:hypothetical protein n=1 Tax=Nitrosopumilus sp. TaxID=2024843 RepID=UPI002624A5AD